jgi:hypothetical protein
MNFNTVHLELRVLFEALRISTRHPRYLFITAVLWGLGLFKPIESRKWRWSFVLLQFIDDLLDGHRASSQPPLEIVKDLKNQIQFRVYQNNFWGQMIQKLMQGFDGDPSAWDAKYEFLNVIDNMMLDYHRRSDKILMPEARLKQHHRETFIPSINLLFMAMGSKSRINENLEFIDLLAWCSIARDLKDDQSRGLFNTPQEFREPENQIQWLNQQTLIAQKNWALASEKVFTLDPKAQKITRLFLKSAQKYLTLQF